MTKVVCLVLILLQNLVQAQYYQSCLTPNRVNGLCQPIRTCASVLALLQQPITDETRRFLRGSQCKIDTDPWVCCPSTTTNAATPKPATSFNTATTSKLPKAPNCGIDSPNRIFGGEETKIDEFPWLVQIQYTKPGNKKGFHCGGSLINQRYVLTAAHCIKKVPETWKVTGVRLGEWDTTTDNDCDDSFTNERVCNDPHVDISVEEQIVHENYQPSTKDQHDDIALLRLSRNVRYTEFIKPICLPWDSNLQSIDLSGMSLDVAGWGKTETSSASTRKLKVAISAYTNSRCQGIYSSSNIRILDNQICAGGETGKDSCNGDSGGPLMRYHERGSTPHYFLAGIVSYGPRNCGTKDIPGVYTRVSKYANWIESNIRT